MRTTEKGSRDRGRQRTRRLEKRLHCIPPAIMREPDEAIEGIHLLGEHKDDGDLALLLFRSLRAVTLWASVQPEMRRGLFSEESPEKGPPIPAEAKIDRAIQIPLLQLMTVLTDPENAAPDDVAPACLLIADWAASKRTLGTALSFAQAAAVTSPEDPLPAHEAGRHAFRWGRLARAESWMRVALALSRRAEDWRIYSKALIALADIHARRGELVRARHTYQRACINSKRHALREERARGFHGLFLIEMQMGALEDADRHARFALRGYRSGHPRRPSVLLDFASLLVLTGGEAEAAAVLQEALKSVDGQQRALGMALLARATATSDVKRYAEAFALAWEHMRHVRQKARSEHGMILLHLAHAASLANDRRALREVTQWYAANPRLFDAQTAEHLTTLTARSRGAGG